MQVVADIAGPHCRTLLRIRNGTVCPVSTETQRVLHNPSPNSQSCICLTHQFSQDRGAGFGAGSNTRHLAKDSIKLMPEFKNVKTWTEHLGHSRLRSITDEDGSFWLEQNSAKDSKWAKLARQGHDVAWEFDSPGGSYTGRILIDGEIYTTAEATKKFLRES